MVVEPPELVDVMVHVTGFFRDPGAWEARYEAWAVEGDRAVATGTSRYDDADGKRLYHNVFLITFDTEGRCREFTEIFETQK